MSENGFFLCTIVRRQLIPALIRRVGFHLRFCIDIDTRSLFSEVILPASAAGLYTWSHKKHCRMVSALAWGEL